MNDLCKKLVGLGAADPATATAEAVGSGFDMVGEVFKFFSSGNVKKGKEAERDGERAKAYGQVESARQGVFLQDSRNTQSLFDGLFATRQKELELQKANPYSGLIFLGVGALVVGAGIWYANSIDKK